MTRTAQAKLLDDLIEYAGRHGLSQASLREIATGIGTSHRMLIHHFGSKEGVLVAVVGEVERRQREAVRELGEHTGDPNGLWPIWERWCDPQLAPYARLFFELYGQALQGRSWATPLLDGAIDTWIAPVAQALAASGADSDPAAVRLAIAVTRGLLLDLLATGDRAAVDEAMRRFVHGALSEPQSTSGSQSRSTS